MKIPAAGISSVAPLFVEVGDFTQEYDKEHILVAGIVREPGTGKPYSIQLAKWPEDDGSRLDVYYSEPA